VNPFNRALTCGGSSGGEGSLIALKGSPLGIGSDIGGEMSRHKFQNDSLTRLSFQALFEFRVHSAVFMVFDPHMAESLILAPPTQWKARIPFHPSLDLSLPVSVASKSS
jgi:hypothetical protein